jgi:hypothetical protein
MMQQHFPHGIWALFLGVCSTALFAEDTRTPATVVPVPMASAIAPFTLAVVAETKKSTGEIKFQYTILRSMVVTQREQDGKSIQTIRNVPETVTTQMPLAAYSLFDSKGNKLTVGAFLDRVKVADVIVVYAGGRLPDPRYLGIFKDGTLILVHGDPNTAPISANPNPPSGYAPNPR